MCELCKNVPLSTQKVDMQKLFTHNGVKRSIEEYYAETGVDLPKEMSMQEALHAYLMWQGILGFTEQILYIVDSVKKEGGA